MIKVISCGEQGVEIKVGQAWIRIGPTELRNAGLMSGRGGVPFDLTDKQKKVLMDYAVRKYGGEEMGK